MAQPLFVRPLTEQEKKALLLRAASPSKEDAWRRQVILFSAEGRTAAAIGESLGFHQTNVKKWIRRFNESGLGGLTVLKRGPREGPKPRFSKSQVQKILHLASTDPSRVGYNFKLWTAQKLASAAMEQGIVDRISHVTVRQILIRHGVNLSDKSAGSADSMASTAAPSSLDLGKQSFS